MVNHTLREPPHALAHDVWVASGTLLETLMRERLEGDTCAVNSRHHQAPGALGKGLVASATAPDGVIEAIEDPANASVSACSGTPRTSIEPANFAHSSRDS
jgi:putative glutamine amidotransferase